MLSQTEPSPDNHQHNHRRPQERWLATLEEAVERRPECTGIAHVHEHRCGLPWLTALEAENGQAWQMNERGRDARPMP